jgi:hypothetical protein
MVTTSHPGFMDTEVEEDVPYPTAAPAKVAERSIAAWVAYS